MSAVTQAPSRFGRIARTVAAFVVAPIVPGLLTALPDLIRGDPMARWYIEFAAKAGYPVILILGVPTYFLLKHWRRSGLGSYLVAGAVWGAAAYFAAFLPGLLARDPGVSAAMAATTVYLVLSIICGAIAALAFWLIARPDR